MQKNLSLKAQVFLCLYSMKIKSSLGNEVEDRTGVHQGKLTTDNFDFRRVLVCVACDDVHLSCKCPVCHIGW